MVPVVRKNGIPKIGIASAVSHNGKLVIDSVDFQFGEEVEAIRTLLRSNDFKGLWVTVDALHCNRKTVDLMHQRMVRYCLRLRKNQKKIVSNKFNIILTNVAVMMDPIVIPASDMDG